MPSSAVRRILASWIHTSHSGLVLAASVCPVGHLGVHFAHNSSMQLPSVPQAQQGRARSLGTSPLLVCCSSSSSSSRQPGPAAGPRRRRPGPRLQQLHRMQAAKPTERVPVQQQQQQQQEDRQPQQSQQQSQQRQRRQTFASPAAELRWHRARMLSRAAPNSTSTAGKLQQQQQQQLRAQHTHGVSSHGMAPVIAASSAADGVEFLFSAAAAGTGGSNTSDQQPFDDPSLQQQQQQQQASEGSCASMPPWHDFSSSSSSSGRWHHSHHQQQQRQQQQQALMQDLQALPTSTGPVAVDITHLLNLQQQADQEEHTWTTSNSGKGSRKKLTTEQRQLQMLNRTGLQQLLWVTIHQPRGGCSPAAVWVKAWSAELAAESLQFSDRASGRVSVLFEAQARPDVGQQPMAVVEGLRFCQQAPMLAGSSSGAAGGAPDISSSSISDNSAVGGDGAAAGSSSSGGVYDFLLLCAGDFSPLEHENMFPNAMVHCGDGRQLHSARGAHDVAAFVAEPDLARIDGHCRNLLRCAWDQRDRLVSSGPVWAYGLLLARWGPVALARFGVDLVYVSRCLGEVIPLLPLPTGPRSSSAAAGSVQEGQAADASVAGAAASVPVPMPV